MQDEDEGWDCFTKQITTLESEALLLLLRYWVWRDDLRRMIGWRVGCPT